MDNNNNILENLRWIDVTTLLRGINVVPPVLSNW